jgi:hypothetical protein
MIARKYWFLYLLVGFFLLKADNALAYLDPGVGSLLLQGILSFLFAALVVAGAFWRRIKKFLDRFTKH